MESKPVSKGSVKEATKYRLTLITTVSALPDEQFEFLVFALNPPRGIIPNKSAPLGARCKALLDWAESPNGCGLESVEESLGIIIGESFGVVEDTPEAYEAFAISGSVGDSTHAEIHAIVELLKKRTGDETIEIAFYEEGSIKLVLSGSKEGLDKLEELFESGELTEVLEKYEIKYVQPVDSQTRESRKALLVRAVRLHGRYALRTLSRNLAQARSYALELAQWLDYAQERAHALNIIRPGIDLAEVSTSLRMICSNIDRRAKILATDLANARDLARSLAHASDQELISTESPAFDLVQVLARCHSQTDDLAQFLGQAIHINRSSSTRTRSELDLTSARVLSHALKAVDLRLKSLAQSLNSYPGSNLDLSGADLSGANLTGIPLIGVDLTDTDLTNALVGGAIFGNNPGLSAQGKANLQSRGAIFRDSPDFDLIAHTPVWQ